MGRCGAIRSRCPLIRSIRRGVGPRIGRGDGSLGTNWLCVLKCSLFLFSSLPSPLSLSFPPPRNYQKIVLQESPGTVPAGRVPRYKEVILTADLIDRARPGEDIEVTGTYKYRAEGLSGKQKGGFPVFSTCIEANYIHKREDLFSMFHITDDDKADIHRIAAAPNTAELLTRCV